MPNRDVGNCSIRFQLTWTHLPPTLSLTVEDVARCWTKEVAEPGENSAGRGGGGGGGWEIANPSSSPVEEAALLLLVKLLNSCLRELNEVRISFSFASTSTGNPSRCSTSPALSSCISLDPSCTSPLSQQPSPVGGRGPYSVAG